MGIDIKASDVLKGIELGMDIYRLYQDFSAALESAVAASGLPPEQRPVVLEECRKMLVERPLAALIPPDQLAGKVG